jgi:uncharacterized membrane protein YGL010W
MRTLTQQLTQYAAYHRDPRNIATHFVGIPMIVLAVQVLLSRPVWDLGAVALTPALALSVVTAAYYLWLDRPLGALMTALLALGMWAAHGLAAQSTSLWLWSGIGLFVVGWVIQFIGHYWEGRKPAFVDDLVGLVIGPLFVATEAAFALGARRELQHAIEADVGPVRRRDHAVPSH